MTLSSAGAVTTLKQNTLLTRTILDTAAIRILEQGRGDRGGSRPPMYFARSALHRRGTVGGATPGRAHPDGADISKFRVARMNGEVAWVYPSLTALIDKQG